LSLWFSKLYALPVAAPVYASDRTSRCAPQDSGSGWIRCSFPVGLFHSLLHAGLSRRSVCPTCFHQFSKGVHPHCVQAISRLSACATTPSLTRLSYWGGTDLPSRLSSVAPDCLYRDSPRQDPARF